MIRSSRGPERTCAAAPDVFVGQIEDRVSADLQFIRLNGAVVGGLVGIALALAHWLAG